MPFQMNDIPLDDPEVAEAMVRCLQKGDRAFNDALIETENLMSRSNWKTLRRGVGHILGGGMYELWAAIVKRHPQFETAAFGK